MSFHSDPKILKSSNLNSKNQEFGEVEKIDEIRKLIMDQNVIASTKHKININSKNNEFEIPFKRFSTLPDIPREDDPFYRTESNLKMEKLENEQYHHLDNSEKTQTINYVTRKDTFYHFAPSNANKIHLNQKLASLENHLSLRNALDLDEDLPLFNEPTKLNQRQVFTCPVSRMISPVNRPQAPSPPSSALRKRNILNSESDSESISIL